MEEEEEIQLELTFSLEELNVILQALSKEPFKDVFQIIGKINDIASKQLNNNEDSSQ